MNVFVVNLDWSLAWAYKTQVFMCWLCWAGSYLVHFGFVWKCIRASELWPTQAGGRLSRSLLMSQVT